MAIYFSNHETNYLLKNKRKVVNWIKEISSIHNKKVTNISIIFSNDKYILEINNKYLKHNYYTDIITFDYSYEDKIEGDIFISIDTVLSNSNIFNTNFNDELLRVIIHGILHLIGFNDKSNEEKEIMRNKENESLEIYYKRYE
jgi:probable rRNA maturation factor